MGDQQFDTLVSKLDLLNTKVSQLEKVIFRGNGHSMITRLTLLEKEILRDNTKAEVKERRIHALIMAILGLVFSIVGSVATFILIGA